MVENSKIYIDNKLDIVKNTVTDGWQTCLLSDLASGTLQKFVAKSYQESRNFDLNQAIVSSTAVVKLQPRDLPPHEK